MFVCEKCKYGEISNKDDDELTEEEQSIIATHCEGCSTWDDDEESFVAKNFEYKR